MAKLIDGKLIASQVRAQIATDTAVFKAKYGRTPGLHVILAGEDPASAVYVRNKEKSAAEVGFVGEVHRMPTTVSQEELLAKVSELNADPTVDGILVQLPLPAGLDDAPILESIDPTKDVDGFHASNVGALWSGADSLVPCTPQGSIVLLKRAGVEIAGANALVIGRSNIVGKPLAALLLAENATVTVAHSRTKNLPELCKQADIVLAAVGRAKMVKGEWLKPGCAVIDVGINRDEAGKLCGDVDFESAEPVAGAISPVPGGVGPMTIAMLLENTLKAATRREEAK